MSKNPQRECSEDPNIHTYGEYIRCLNSKISNPYTVGYEIAPASNTVVIVVVIIIIIIILLILSYKYNMGLINLIESFFKALF